MKYPIFFVDIKCNGLFSGLSIPTNVRHTLSWWLTSLNSDNSHRDLPIYVLLHHPKYVICICKRLYGRVTGFVIAYIQLESWIIKNFRIVGRIFQTNFATYYVFCNTECTAVCQRKIGLCPSFRCK
jgi:hypothetical protein